MSSKTITMKVDLSCCDECVQRMKRLLRRHKEVESSSIDVKNRLVIVSGHIHHPEKIIDKIRKKGKSVTLFSIHSDDDDDDDDMTENTNTKPSLQTKNRNKDFEKSRSSSESDQQRPSDGENHKCKVHSGQNRKHKSVEDEVYCDNDLKRGSDSSCYNNVYESRRFCARDGDHQDRAAHFDPHQAFPKFHAHDRKRVHFADGHHFCGIGDFDCVHYDYRNYPEMMSHYYQGQTIPKQQFRNGPMNFGTQFFSDHNSSRCLIM